MPPVDGSGTLARVAVNAIPDVAVRGRSVSAELVIPVVGLRIPIAGLNASETESDMNDRALLLVSAIVLLMLAIAVVVLTVAIDAASGIVAGITDTGGT